MKGAIILDKLTERPRILSMVAETFEEERIIAGLGYAMQHGGLIRCETDVGELTIRLDKENKK